MLCINAGVVLLWVPTMPLLDETHTEFCGGVFFRILCVNAKGVLQLGMTLLLTLGDDIDTDAGDEEWSFRRSDGIDEALLLALLLLMGEDAYEVTGKRTSLGIASGAADVSFCLIFAEADNTPMRQSGGSTSLVTNTTPKTSSAKHVKQKNSVLALSITIIQINDDDDMNLSLDYLSLSLVPWL